MGETKSLVIVGRRWFERTNGNTYFSAEIYVNGKHVHKIDFQYGYGSHYSWEAARWLDDNGYLPDLEHYDNGNAISLSRHCSEKGIELTDTVTDVSRKKDL